MVTAGPNALGVLPDAALLRRFAVAKDEAAFEELVRRHGRLVWNVCRRQLARREDSEDAFQATFLALAVHAGAIRTPEALPGWLHRTACHAAARAASSVASDPLRDVPAHGLDAVAQLALREAVVAIDEELIQLPRRYQSALVLFHLVRFTNTPIADALDAVATAHKLELVADQQAFADAGLLDGCVRDTVSLEVGDVSLAKVLDAILRPKGLAYVLRGDELHVTAADRSRTAPDRLQSPRTAGAEG